MRSRNDQQALHRIEIIFDAKKGTKEGDELEILGILIDHYKNEHFPIDLPDPIEAIKFRMEQLGYLRQIKQKSLELRVEQVKYLVKRESYLWT